MALTAFGSGEVMANLPDVVGLLYRADWTRLSLAAEVNTGFDFSVYLKSVDAPKPPWPRVEMPEPPDDPDGLSSRRLTLLIAPGRRYRQESEDSGSVAGCDGERCWERPAGARFNLRTPPGIRGDRDTPMPELFCPASLLTGFVLDVRGPVTACGRDAVHVVATPRPSMHDRTGEAHLKLDRIEAIVDAELGILLHRQEMFDGQILSLSQLTSLTLNPPEAADDSRFRPPPDSVTPENLGEKVREFFDQPGWQAAKTAAGLAAGGLGAWVRVSPFWPGGAAASDPEPGMPPDEPGPPDPSPVSDEVLYLLYRTGSQTPELTATLHEWLEVAALLTQIPDAARGVGYGGVGNLVDAVGSRTPRAHTAARVRTGGHGRYRIDYVVHPGKHPPKAVAYDGQRHWALFQDRLKTGPAAPPPSEVASLVDASWLLECRLSGGAEVTVADRRGYRISIADGVSPFKWVIVFPAEAGVDAELGVLLRLTCYAEGRPVTRCELRDVGTEPTGPDAYRIEAPPGVRTVEASDNPLADAVAEAPGPVGVAARAAVDVAKRTGSAVSAARGFLDNLRRQLRQNESPQPFRAIL
jgi:hypothetical protein